DFLWIFTGPETADALTYRFLVLVRLNQRQIQQARLRGVLQRLQIILSVGPPAEVLSVGVVRIAERIAQRIGKLHALIADLFAVEPLDKQIRLLFLFAGRGDRESEARRQLGMPARRKRVADLICNLRL